VTEEKKTNEELSDEEAIRKIAEAMKDNAPSSDEKQNIHTFLINVVQGDNIGRVMKTGNLRDDKEINELGVPQWNVRGAMSMARISRMLMNNEFYAKYFEEQAKETLGTSLSREGFLIRTAATQTKQVVDATKRTKRNKGMFKSSTESSGGDILIQREGGQ